MNVTPLVDVVLVLLIIFMVVTPLFTKQFWLRVPEKNDSVEAAPSDAPLPVVLSVRVDGRVQINREDVPQADLKDRLRRIFAARRDHVLFFDADDGVPFGRSMEVLDLARGGGALTIAVLTEQGGS